MLIRGAYERTSGSPLAGTNKLRSVDVAVSKDEPSGSIGLMSGIALVNPIFVDIYATGEISETFWGSVVNNVDLVG